MEAFLSQQYAEASAAGATEQDIAAARVAVACSTIRFVRHKQREPVIKQFTEKFAKCSNWAILDKSWQNTIVRRIERSCFNNAIAATQSEGVARLFTEKKFVDRYSAECYKVLCNIQPENTYLINRIFSGLMPLNDIAKATPLELAPDANQAERMEIELRQSQKIKNKVSRSYKCRKCNGNETIPKEYQARSVDESSSFSIRCVNCNFIWRI